MGTPPTHTHKHTRALYLWCDTEMVLISRGIIVDYRVCEWLSHLQLGWYPREIRRNAFWDTHHCDLSLETMDLRAIIGCGIKWNLMVY